MFEVKADLKVSKENFYNLILASLKYDYNENIKDSADVEIKPGLNYYKQIQYGDKLVKSLFKVTTLLPNKLYEAEISNQYGEMLIRYLLEDKNNKQITVTYQEEFLSEEVIEKKGFSTWLINRRRKKAIVKALKTMERQIISDLNMFESTKS